MGACVCVRNSRSFFFRTFSRKKFNNIKRSDGSKYFPQRGRLYQINFIQFEDLVGSSHLLYVYIYIYRSGSYIGVVRRKETIGEPGKLLKPGGEIDSRTHLGRFSISQ